MPIANVGAVPDVVTNTLIASDWGNAIGAASRGRVVQRFNSLAERDSSIAAPVTGMLCYVLATDLFYGYRTASGWTALIGGPRDTTHAKVYRAAAWTVPASYAAVPFDTIQRDPMGMWTPAQNGFMVPTAGIYQVSAQLTSAGGPGSFAALQFIRAGAAFASVGAHGSMGYGIGPACSTPVAASAGDVITMQATATPAGAALTGVNNFYFAIDYLGTG
jgi:hypothetical protein